ncbi:hypothetical protein D9613_003568 [Agrocybe pediades]|uniref:Uncharacterized protein n=1 Tax=Agrocybe pediades TaxID=84607 RepID=A0A8H4QKC3_9AGAR|nr:hypothetical protein D9613_003568 [Agrocybe pediades]
MNIKLFSVSNQALLTLWVLLQVTFTLGLDLASSSWIWTTEFTGSQDITVDNFYVLYVNGAVIGQRTSSNNWQQAGRFCVGLSPTTNVIAVNGTNEAIGRAGVLAAIQVTYSDGTITTSISDVSWKATSSLPSGFQTTTFNDASWPAAVISGGYAVWPYAPITTPAGPAAACAGCIAV